MTVIAQFQGVLTVPIYITPYSYPVPNNAPGAALVNSVGSQALVATNNSPFYMIRQSSLGTTSAGVTGSSVVSGWAGLLTPAYAATLQMTGTGGNTVPGTNNVGSPIMYQNNLVNTNLQIYNNQAWANYASTPFYANKTMANIASPCMQVNELNTPAVSATNLEFVGLNAASLTNIVLTFGGVPLGNFEGFSIPFAPAAAAVYLATFLGLQKQAYCLNTGIGGASFFGKFNTIPSPETGSNYLWTKDIFGNIAVAPYTASYELSTGNFSNVMGTQVPWQTDNAAINALPHVTTFNAQSWMLSTNDGKDYLVSKDGLRYWQLQLVSNVDALYLGAQRTILGNYTEAGGSDNMTTRWIDKSGILWYIGSANRAVIGGINTIQPGFSLRLNLFPPPGVYLPQIPPISGNCWSSCLDRVGGRPGNINPTGQAL